jgi:hypothetical protein
LLASTGVDAPLLLAVVPRVEGVLVLLLVLQLLPRRLRVLLVVLCWGVLLEEEEGGLLMRDAVGWALVGC